MSSVKLNLLSNFKNKKGQGITVSVNLVQFNDSGSIVLYAPALEVYGYGKTIEEAKKSFITCLEEFINYTHSKGTFDKELSRLGWNIVGKKNSRRYETPAFSDLLVNNTNLANIINNKEIQTYNEELPFAM